MYCMCEHAEKMGDHLFTLFESLDAVAAGLCLVQCTGSDAFFSKRGVVRLEWFLSWKEKREFGKLPLYACFRLFGGKEIEDFLIRKVQILL